MWNYFLVWSTDYDTSRFDARSCVSLFLVLHKRRYLNLRDDKHLEPKYKAEYEKNKCKIYVSADLGKSEVPSEVRSFVWPEAKKWSSF